LIENCEFIHSTSTAVSVEGYPGEKTNWVNEYLASLITKQHESPLADSQSSLNNENASMISVKDNSCMEADSIGVASIAGSRASSKDGSLIPSFASSLPSSASSRGRNSRPEDFYSDKCKSDQ